MSRIGRPAKAVNTIDTAKSHRTKKELELRDKGEKALLSGVGIFERKEVKSNPVAHKEFTRVKKLMEKIGKADALYAPVLNRYCEIFCEIITYKERMEDFIQIAGELKEKFNALDAGYDECVSFTKSFTALMKQINTIDAQIMQKRKMLFDIEKENCFTVASALRNIPKNPDKEENPIASLLKEFNSEE